MSSRVLCPGGYEAGCVAWRSGCPLLSARRRREGLEERGEQDRDYDDEEDPSKVRPTDGSNRGPSRRTFPRFAGSVPTILASVVSKAGAFLSAVSFSCSYMVPPT